MLRFALRGLLGRKLRTALTALAIVLGVAMVCGTFVLTDSIDNAFDTIFTESRAGSNAVISGKAPFDVSSDSGSFAPTVPESLLADVRALPGVKTAEGQLNSDTTQLIGDNGKAIVYGGAPNLGFSIANGKSQFNPLTLVDGSWPHGDEVVIDQSTADKEGFHVGEQVEVQAEGPIERLRVSGLVKFGSVSTIGGATLAGFDLPTAQRLFKKPGRLDEIAVASKSGVSDAQLVAQIKPILPPTAQVRTGAQQAQKDAADTNSFISFLRGFLLAFGGIALFVGSFVIANSLSITIAQRTRELATLRTIGANRRQLLSSIVVEALVMGILASLVGLVLGLGLAKLLFWLFDKVGFTLPNTGLVFETRTVVISLLAGILVTLVASLRPAMRATRVPPIAAVREGATLPPGRFARWRTPWGIFVMLVGFAALAYGLFAPDLGTTQLLVWMGVGALLIFLGTALFAARLVPPLSGLVSPIGAWLLVVLSIIFWPFWIFPYWLLRYGAFGRGKAASRRVFALVGGLVLNLLLALIVFAMWVRSRVSSWSPEWGVEFPGVLPDRAMSRIARENSQRNPQRTASTAAALMIGLALVTLVAVLASGITSSFRGAVNRLWGNADYAITAQNNFSPIPVSAADAAARAPGVEAVGNVRVGQARAFGHTVSATAVNPPAATMFDMDWREGSNSLLATLGNDGAFVDDGYADDHHLRVGSPIALTFASGDTKTFVVRGVFKPPTGGSPFGRVTISQAAWDRVNPEPRNLYSFVRTQGGQTDANQAALDRQLGDFPNAKVQTREEFIDNQIAGLNAVLNILYVLLALSVVVSLFGIVNTLVLTVFERTRELGMLRAIGMTRRQVRRMIRYESVITALIGAALGIALGIVLGALLVARVDFIVFSLPWLSLIYFAIAALIVGLIAAIFPARRAARLNPLEALQYE